jgi:hypothetical protein
MRDRHRLHKEHIREELAAHMEALEAARRGNHTQEVERLEHQVGELRRVLDEISTQDEP